MQCCDGCKIVQNSLNMGLSYVDIEYMSSMSDMGNDSAFSARNSRLSWKRLTSFNAKENKVEMFLHAVVFVAFHSVFGYNTARKMLGENTIVTNLSAFFFVCEFIFCLVNLIADIA